MNNVFDLTGLELVDGKLYMEGNSQISVYLLKYTQFEKGIVCSLVYLSGKVTINSSILNINSTSQNPYSNWLKVLTFELSKIQM